MNETAQNNRMPRLTGLPPRVVASAPPPPPRLPPVVFLDVDGVLHPCAGHYFFEPRCMACLRQILEATGAVLVLSSAWQAHAVARADLDAVLRRWGMPVPVARTVLGAPGVGEERRAREPRRGA